VVDFQRENDSFSLWKSSGYGKFFLVVKTYQSDVVLFGLLLKVLMPKGGPFWTPLGHQHVIETGFSNL